MITRQTASGAFELQDSAQKGTPTLGEELREVFRYLFRQPERRLRGTDFLWSYEELADDIPD